MFEMLIFIAYFLYEFSLKKGLDWGSVYSPALAGVSKAASPPCKYINNFVQHKTFGNGNRHSQLGSATFGNGNTSVRQSALPNAEKVGYLPKVSAIGNCRDKHYFAGPHLSAGAVPVCAQVGLPGWRQFRKAVQGKLGRETVLPVNSSLPH